jgi:hypothetical protein
MMNSGGPTRVLECSAVERLANSIALPMKLQYKKRNSFVGFDG